jgi:hypothetical protein
MFKALSQKQIELAVAWWAKTLRNEPTFNTLNDNERRNSQNEGGALAEMMAAGSSGSTPITDEVVKKFSEKLTELLSNEPFNQGRSLMVDYSPCQVLTGALSAAGIQGSMQVLPWKTCMMFWDGAVEVNSSRGRLKLL